MRYLALACDYDGTLAKDGVVGPEALAALHKLRESGRRAILVTGRQLEDLRMVFPQLEVFDRVVCEDGAVLFNPETKEERVLGDEAPQALVELLRERKVEPLSVGRVIIATWEPMQAIVLESIRQLGLESHVIFNKGAVMVLPSGINKATGLAAALDDLSLSMHNVVAVGDAENDHALLAACEMGVAVRNALPSLKERADFVTEGERGAGVAELVEQLLSCDLREAQGKLKRRELELGQTAQGAPVKLHAWGRRLLLCGVSGSGKSTLATGFIEQLIAKQYQLCLLDPEGDYHALPGTVVCGDEHHAPNPDDVVELLREPKNHVIVNMLAVPLDRRPELLTTLMPRLLELRTQLGRPHWIVVDEAHHMLPQQPVELADSVQHLPGGLLSITVHPSRLAKSVLAQMDGVLVVGAEAHAAVEELASVLGRDAPQVSEEPLEPGEAIFWSMDPSRAVVRFRYAAPRAERHRHHRKYASGSLGEDKSFYFRGPRHALNLRAQNLQVFLQLADGIDDATWLYHLRRHDYSRWVREAIKNDDLSRDLTGIESARDLDPDESRRRVRSAIESVYTLSA